MGDPVNGDEDEGSNALDLPEVVESAGHLELASLHTDDEDAYTLEPRISLIRASMVDADLMVEEELVIHLARAPI